MQLHIVRGVSVQEREMDCLDKDTTLKLPRGFHGQLVRIPGLDKDTTLFIYLFFSNTS